MYSVTGGASSAGEGGMKGLHTIIFSKYYLLLLCSQLTLHSVSLKCQNVK